jgi:hypothetical protein
MNCLFFLQAEEKLDICNINFHLNYMEDHKKMYFSFSNVHENLRTYKDHIFFLILKLNFLSKRLMDKVKYFGF